MRSYKPFLILISSYKLDLKNKLLLDFCRKKGNIDQSNSIEIDDIDESIFWLFIIPVVYSSFQKM